MSHKWHDSIHIQFKWDRSVLEIVITLTLLCIRRLLFSIRIIHYNGLSIIFNPFSSPNSPTSSSPLKAISQAWSKDRWWSFIFSGAFSSYVDFNSPPSLQDGACIWSTEISSMYHSLLLSELHSVILNTKMMFKTRLWNMILDYISWSRSVASSLPRKVASVSRLRIT